MLRKLKRMVSIIARFAIHCYSDLLVYNCDYCLSNFENTHFKLFFVSIVFVLSLSSVLWNKDLSLFFSNTIYFLMKIVTNTCFFSVGNKVFNFQNNMIIIYYHCYFHILNSFTNHILYNFLEKLWLLQIFPIE